MPPFEHPSDQSATLRPVVKPIVGPSNIRYRVLSLTFLVAFVMYMDRVCMGTAAPAIMREFQIDKITMGWTVSAFNWAYAIFQIPGGWMADRFGPRIILGVALAWWSLFTAATGATFDVRSLTAARFLFGMGEAAAFPASSRAVVQWLPADLRAFGQGVQHSGSRLGAAIAPALVVVLLARTTWRSVFYIFGSVGAALSLVWFWYYRDRPQEHPKVNAQELNLIGQPADVSKKTLRVPWRRIVRSRDLWFLSSMYFCYGWVLWMYLFWLPTYLVEARHFSQLRMGLGASLPLLAAALTNVAGGWISDKLTRRWNDLRRGRVTVSMIGFGIAALGLIPGVLAKDAVTGVLCLTVALAGLELTVAVSWAIALDIGGDYSGSVSAVMNTFGNLGGALSAVVIGYLATRLGWNWPFLVASAMCLMATLLATQVNPNRSAVLGNSLEPQR
jgi:MFS family permease